MTVPFRRTGRCLWPPSTARLGRPGAPSNRAYLRDRLIALPLLCVLAFASLSWAYGQVRGDAERVRGELAPALVDLADARASVRIAQQEAQSSLRGGAAAELAGLGEVYRKRISRATLALGRVARGGALDVGQQQELQVVSALLDDYGTWVEQAEGHAADPVLRDAELMYAWTMLCSAPPPDPARPTPAGTFPRCSVAGRAPAGADASTIVDRITGLEGELGARLAARAGWGTPVVGAAAVAAVAFVLLALGLWRTLRFLRLRFRVSVCLPLALMGVVLLLVPLPVADAVLVRRALHQVAGSASALAERTSPAVEAAEARDPFGTPPRDSVRGRSTAIGHQLSAGQLPPLDDARHLILPAGLLCATAAALTLYAFRREYVLVSRPGAGS
ncbi:hypothetical protein [Streptomyces sp. NPDC058045]|uniref:hypothetical protein n=1 Tax=Streptomyces sp. NPDC058045 TaxID=3346311 RepID=UPI0036E16ED2